MDSFFGLDHPHVDRELALLTTAHDDVELSILCDILRGEEIPYLTSDRGTGGALRIISGYSVYGTDPIEIVRDWVNIAEDGYLSLHFRFITGNRGTKHFINLLPTNNPNNPYEVEFRHNAYGDNYGGQADGMAAFKLDDTLPDTEGKTVKLTLKWKSYHGEKEIEFDYCSPKD